MRKMIWVLLSCLFVVCLVGCEKKENSTTVQEEKKTEEKEPPAVVNVQDILQTMNSLPNDLGVPQSMKAMLKAGYENNEILQVAGVLTTDNADSLVNNKTVVLAAELSPKSSMTEQDFFICISENNEHVLIPSGTEIVVEGSLKMDETSVLLSNCKFITPDIQTLTFQANVGRVLECAEGTTQIIEGTVKTVTPIELTDNEREDLSGGFVDENDSYYVRAVLGATHKVILTDGTKDIVIYISQNSNENIQVGERIAVKGTIRYEENIFVWGGDAVYFFDR